MDYDDSASAYASTRWALPWIIAPLSNELTARGSAEVVLDIGCGTGDYLGALARLHPACTFIGFDRSERMAEVARQRCPNATILTGNADQSFPLSDATTDVMICVNVMHHLTDYTRFFAEARRVGRPGSVLLVATDSRDDIVGRSLARLFPESVPLNLARYPAIEDLVRFARAAGLSLVGTTEAAGEIEFDDRFVATIEQRGISELRLISDDAHANGLSRVMDARTKGEQWLSRTTVLRFVARPGLE
jgi:SAM-dependent methyltransferase